MGRCRAGDAGCGAGGDAGVALRRYFDTRPKSTRMTRKGALYSSQRTAPQLRSEPKSPLDTRSTVNLNSNKAAKLYRLSLGERPKSRIDFG